MFYEKFIVNTAVFLGALVSAQSCGDMGVNEFNQDDESQNEGLIDLSTNPDEISETLETPEIALTRCEFFIKLLPYLLENINEFTPPDRPTFQDLQKDDECYVPIETAYATGIYSGTYNGQFPTGQSGKDLLLNRAEAAKLILETLDLSNQSCYGFSFNDVLQKHWFHTYVSSLVKAGLLCGIDSKKSGQSFGDCFMPASFLPSKDATTKFVDIILDNFNNPKPTEGICE